MGFSSYETLGSFAVERVGLYGMGGVRITALSLSFNELRQFFLSFFKRKKQNIGTQLSYILEEG